MSATDFWNFSVAVYGQPGVAPACLALQDEWQLDVNVLLFCLFAASRGHTLQANELQALEEAVRPWREQVVRPLRAVRRWLKAPQVPAALDIGSLRQQVQGLELLAERSQQMAMTNLVALGSGAPSAEVAAGNLQAYARLAGCAVEGAAKQALCDLWVAAHPSLGEAPSNG